jgi:hypothetical protein
MHKHTLVWFVDWGEPTAHLRFGTLSFLWGQRALRHSHQLPQLLTTAWKMSLQRWNESERASRISITSSA